ncbi:MAG TPA: carbohydrate-binding protein [Vicinamibacterales bacterium]|nr:carbohydrate-binding protein [Vicinamibacterales bacterium]
MAALLLLGMGFADRAHAQEQIFFPATDDARSAVLQKIRSESKRLDIAVWLLEEHEISIALVQKHQAGVPVRVLGDRASIFESSKLTRAEFEYLASNGVPIRLRYFPTFFPETMHWKAGIFVGQNTVEFGSANWTAFELRPVSETNFKDETALFTNDSPIVNAFLTKFDQMWVDTTYFLDWPEAYRRETGQTWPTAMNIQRVRLEPDYPTNIPGFVWGQGSEMNNAMITEINRETQGVYLVSYRLTVNSVTDALIRKHTVDKVPVRVIIEPTQYRNSAFPEYWLVGSMADRLWAAGIQMKQRAHTGLTHMKLLLTSNVATVGSSNFTKNWQRDHNYFVSILSKPQLYQTIRDRIEAMWNDNVNFGAFYPKPPNAPTLVAPANTATGVTTPARLEWNRAPWAVAFDVYIGTSSSSMTFAGRVNAVVNEEPPATYSFTPSSLQPGTTYFWRVVSKTFASECLPTATRCDPTLVASSATRSFTTAGSSGGGGTGSGPFGGTPVALPGTIQAEQFDNGGSGVAYFDTTAGNSGGAYRSTDVDIQTTSDTGGGYNIGWLKPGEWLKYTVNVSTAGVYDLEFRVASSQGGARFHLEANGTNITGPMEFPSSGGSQSWTTIKKTGVSLAAGTQVWTLMIDSTNANGGVGNVNYIRVVAGSGTPPPPTGSTPFGGTAAALPGVVQSENFDEGGRNVAYSDTTTGNSGGAYRSTDVDIQATSDGGPGYNIGWMKPGEWLKYTVNVTTTGVYTLEFRVASSSGGAKFHVEVNGTDVTGPMMFPTSGGTQSWATIAKTGVSLTAGTQVWKFVVDSANSSGGVGNINYIRAVAGSSSSASSTPFGGTPAALPGVVQAEHFDEGGRDVAYVDTTAGNAGGAYRSTDVDIEATSDTGGGYNIGWLKPGEWLHYTVDVAAAGVHMIQVRLASSLGGARFHIQADGVNVTGPLTFPTTGGTQNWTTLTKTGVDLEAGVQVLKLVIDSPNTSGGVGNINYISVAPESTVSGGTGVLPATPTGLVLVPSA